MHSLDQLEKQQVGLRLPKYLVEEIDEFTKQYNVNRTDIIMEAVKSYVSEQKANMFYDHFDDACREIKSISSARKKKEDLQSLSGLIDELEDH